MESGPRFFNSRRVIFWLLSLSVIAILVGLWLPRVKTGKSTTRTECANNLRQIALALMSYEAEKGHLPPAYTIDGEGQKLHSWRVLILPYLDHEPLYSTIDLAKPWNDPVNQKARQNTPAVYQCPARRLEPQLTTYVANIASKRFFGSNGEALELSSLSLEQMEQILVFEVNWEMAIEWMSPEDGDEETFNQLLAAEKLPHISTFQAALADGSIARFYPSDQDYEFLLKRLVDDE